jgi:peptidoglycan/xylan/chitin deacetylase (PgdA/CDA1 family)
VQRDLHDGGVVLLHDGGGPRAETVGALRELLPWLRDQGYRIVLPDDPAAPAAPDGAGSAEPDEAR